MFETLQPLSPDQDQHTHFAPAQGWHFASALKLCPIGAREAETLAREYVIVFSQDAESMPIVLLSLGDTSAGSAMTSATWSTPTPKMSWQT